MPIIVIVPENTKILFRSTRSTVFLGALLTKLSPKLGIERVKTSETVVNVVCFFILINSHLFLINIFDLRL